MEAAEGIRRLGTGGAVGHARGAQHFSFLHACKYLHYYYDTVYVSCCCAAIVQSLCNNILFSVWCSLPHHRACR